MIGQIGQLGQLALDRLSEQVAQARDALTYPNPMFQLLVNGRDITSDITARLISITLTDNRGIEADQLDIALSDHDGLLAVPPKNASLELWLGWSDVGLTYKGQYTVDELQHSGAPDVLSIRARSADLRKGLATKRSRSFHEQKLQGILRTIAGAYGLTPVVDAVLGALTISHLDQTDESDLNLITRLGSEHDAVASIKAERLLFMPIGAGKTSSGLSLPHISLTRADGDQHSYLDANRDTYSGVKAYYYDVGSAEKKHVIAGADDNAKTLRHVYTDQASALAAARAEWRRLKRGTATLTYTLARGRPDLIPELTYSLTGIKEVISDIVWLGSNVVHNFTTSSYTTSLDLTSQLPEDDELQSNAEQQYTGVLAKYRDEKTGTQNTLTAGEQTSPKRLTHLYASKASAQRAVDREWARIEKPQA